MCGLCGTVGGPAHWSEGAAWLDTAQTRRAQRLQQVNICNTLLQPLGLRLDDWQGSAFILSSSSGRREIVHSMPEVWLLAQRMTGTTLNLLNSTWLAGLAAIKKSE